MEASNIHDRTMGPVYMFWAWVFHQWKTNIQAASCRLTYLLQPMGKTFNPRMLGNSKWYLRLQDIANTGLNILTSATNDPDNDECEIYEDCLLVLTAHTNIHAPIVKTNKSIGYHTLNYYSCPAVVPNTFHNNSDCTPRTH